MSSASSDEQYMKQALRLASKGLGRTSPNPMVGAVIVRADQIIGRGYHHYFGGDHAEVEALKHATADVSGATMYVNLEPCRHWGKTPPCVDAIVKAGLGRVVIGMLDPFPEMRGKSVEFLQQHGIETEVGVLEEECRTLNEAYIKYVTKGVPLVTVKFAQTLDGRIATAGGSARWISSEESRRLAHRLRAINDAVLVGAGTVLADDPELTVRLVRGRSPVRIVLDSGLRVPLESRVLLEQEKARTIIATTPKADPAKVEELEQKGIEVMKVPANQAGEVDIPSLLPLLGKRGIASLLVEGGSSIITSFLRLGLADRLVAIVAPKILGSGIETVGDLNITDVGKALKLSFSRTYRSGADLVIEAKVETG
jgi:diaminohydroxyphosphoribosylaminopyrimidine deaminase/5-amino-6-(5-phosphoribosylamino)uracil reductase